MSLWPLVKHSFTQHSFSLSLWMEPWILSAQLHGLVLTLSQVIIGSGLQRFTLLLVPVWNAALGDRFVEGENFLPGIEFMVVWHRKKNLCEDAGECQDEARSLEGPGLAWAPWKCRTIVDGIVDGSWHCPFWGPGGSYSASAALCGGQLPQPSSPSMSPCFLDIRNRIRDIM